MPTTTDSPSPRIPSGTRDSRKHTPKVDMRGLYQRAIRESFVKLDPRITVKNPVMFVVWVGTIVTFLVTLNPNLFGTIQADINQQRLLNGLITFILFFTLVFANFAEAVAEGRGKAQADSLRSILRNCDGVIWFRWLPII
jgi:K+-transporting ATPase ATPase B chain